MATDGDCPHMYIVSGGYIPPKIIGGVSYPSKPPS